MNKWLILAGMLSAGIFLLHTFGGEVAVHKPLLADASSSLNGAFSSLLWHFATAALLINTVALFIAARNAAVRKPLVWLVIAQYLAFIGLFLFYGATRLGNVLTMPQWIFFTIILIPAWLGVKERN